jgi:hypothetical protein
MCVKALLCVFSVVSVLFCSVLFSSLFFALFFTILLFSVLLRSTLLCSSGLLCSALLFSLLLCFTLLFSNLDLNHISFDTQLGVTAPAGFFDPLGLSANIDQETFDQYRTAELKHGRVAQLAVLGYIVPEIYKFPGDIAPGVSFASIPNGIAAIEAVPTLGWLQMIFLIGAVDYWGLLTLGDTTGGKKSEAELIKAKVQELNHGRLAMIAILELLRHDSQSLIGGMYSGDHLITGLPFLY